MRQQFPFYKSFDDVAEDLTDNQLAQYIRTLLDVQFLRIKIDDVKFKDKMLNMAWKSQKHSIRKSIMGFLDGQKRDTIKNPYFGAYVVPTEGMHEGIQTPDLQVQCKEEVKEQGKEEVQVCKEFSFTLKTQKQFDTLSLEYTDKLNKYIFDLPMPHLSFEEFRDGCLSKGYKYKNFKLAYNKWNKNYKPNNQKQLSFKEQDRQRTDQIADVVLNKGHNPFDPSNYSQQKEEYTDVQLTN